MLGLSLIATNLLCCLSFVLGVAGHGYVHNVVINGQTYPGWNPFSDPYAGNPVRVVRKILSDGPVPADSDLACGIGGKDGTPLIADAPAGSQVSFQWEYWPSDHQGPVSTYMASCNGDCTTFSADTARWFKLDADGYSNGQWGADRLRADGNTWTSTIPASLSPGQYLIRHEIVALHSQTPQFYPMCSQLTVSGSGTSQPSESDLVSIPALYSGVKWPNIYTDFGTFAMPGPPPVAFGQGGGNLPPTTPPTGTSTPAATSIEAYPDQQGTNASYGASATYTTGPAGFPGQGMPSSPTAGPTPTQQPQSCHLTSRKLLRRRFHR